MNLISTNGACWWPRWTSKNWEECYQQLTGDASKRIWDATDKLSSKAVSEIIEFFIVMAEKKNATLKKKAKPAAPTAGELATDPLQHAYTRCGVNSMEGLTKSHLVKMGLFSELGQLLAVIVLY